MSRGARTWLLVAVAAAIVATTALLASGGAGARALEDRAQAVAAGLRCPVCVNLSVADSPSRLAGEMRAEIQDQLRAGQTEEEVRAFFVERYGEWVLLEPTRRGLNLLPWLFPFAAAIGGFGIWFGVLRPKPGGDPAPVSDAERLEIERELAELEDAP